MEGMGGMWGRWVGCGGDGRGEGVMGGDGRGCEGGVGGEMREGEGMVRGRRGEGEVPCTGLGIPLTIICPPAQ